MSDYFKYFPNVTYNDVLATNLTRRAAILRKLKNKPYVFLPYTVEEDLSAEQVAQYYYGSQDYVWLIYFSNDIIDPYTQWVMPQDVFNDYLTKKYQADRDKAEENDGFSGTVIDWTRRESTGVTDNIVYYQNNEDPNLRLNKESHKRDDWDEISSNWTAIRVYQYENELNENRRQIKLINKDYLPLALRELRTIF